MQKHCQISQFYNWADIARRTERVYAKAIGREEIKIGERLTKLDMGGEGDCIELFNFSYLNAGYWFGLVWAWASALNFLFATFLDSIDPREHIKMASD